jgi:hypothetical protein
MSQYDNRPFLLFCGQTYYPDPGWQGYFNSYATLDEAETVAKQRIADSADWWQVVDVRTRLIVAGEGAGHTGLFGLVSAGPTYPQEP